MTHPTVLITSTLSGIGRATATASYFRPPRSRGEALAQANLFLDW